MRTQNHTMQTLSLTVVIVATFALPVFSQDGTIIHFDFINDGEILPWAPVPGFNPNLELDDGLVLQRPNGTAIAEAKGLDFANYTDTSIRAQFRLIEGRTIGIGVRGGSGTVAATVDPGSGENKDILRLTESPPRDIIEPVTIDLQVDMEDIVMQLDSIGQSLEVRVWRPGDTMPTDATLSAPLPKGLTANGPPWLIVASDGLKSKGVFREVWVSDVVIPIPEPSSVCLFCLGLFGLIARAGRQPQLSQV